MGYIFFNSPCTTNADHWMVVLLGSIYCLRESNGWYCYLVPYTTNEGPLEGGVVIVNTTICIAPLVARHFQGASQECQLSALLLMLGITDQVQFQLYFESRKGFDFLNSCRKTVPSMWTSNLAHFSLCSKPLDGDVIGFFISDLQNGGAIVFPILPISNHWMVVLLWSLYYQ